MSYELFKGRRSVALPLLPLPFLCLSLTFLRPLPFLLCLEKKRFVVWGAASTHRCHEKWIAKPSGDVGQIVLLLPNVSGAASR